MKRTPEPKPARAAGVVPRRRGGRSGDRERYTALTVYIDKPVYRDFKAQLAREDPPGHEFSYVLTGLMRDWLERKKSKHPKA